MPNKRNNFGELFKLNFRKFVVVQQIWNRKIRDKCWREDSIFVLLKWLGVVWVTRFLATVWTMAVHINQHQCWCVGGLKAWKGLGESTTPLWTPNSSGLHRLGLCTKNQTAVWRPSWQKKLLKRSKLPIFFWIQIKCKHGPHPDFLWNRTVESLSLTRLTFSHFSPFCTQCHILLQSMLLQKLACVQEWSKFSPTQHYTNN